MYVTYAAYRIHYCLSLALCRQILRASAQTPLGRASPLDPIVDFHTPGPLDILLLRKNSWLRPELYKVIKNSTRLTVEIA